ncbi:hypothetical protein ESA94_07610 [Lacibacter luteus]|uniref:Uncharacterized protein n=1 Tax=Lacibacter luteus TaxID=2508719 RepID=A0A4Q1CIE0_9BACT|nr:hypothetical protein ESA94_07610 [Lacibacter luteus]
MIFNDEKCKCALFHRLTAQSKIYCCSCMNNSCIKNRNGTVFLFNKDRNFCAA